MWERTRGAGSSVFKLADSGRIKRGESEGQEADEWKAEDVLPTLEDVESKLYEVSADDQATCGVRNANCCPSRSSTCRASMCC